jgi:DNA-binding transcriptional regulator YdaS (Cro superfamily)
MNLKEYIQSYQRTERAKIKKNIEDVLKVSSSTVRLWMCGKRRMASEKALRLEEWSDGLLTRYDLRPDIYPREILLKRKKTKDFRGI